MAAGGLTMRELRKFTAPRVMALIAAICFADALYMLSLYQVSPVAPGRARFSSRTRGWSRRARRAGAAASPVALLGARLNSRARAQAFAWISPVYVTAIKRGGGILLSSLLGTILFGESMAGRIQPIITICIGVTFLCL